jgi:Bacterial membrane protein YfhO
MTSLLLFLLYGLGVAAVAGVATWVRRPIPRVPLLVCSLLPVLFLLPGFTGDTTPIPVDHVRTLAPWRAPGPVTVRNPNLIDVALQIAPWQAAVREAWSAGEWPHRNRWNACGGPLAANGQSGAYSPLTLLSLALPLGRAFTLQGALKLLLALSGTWLWLSELRVSRGAALFGAIAFAFSLSITPWLFFPIASVVCLWPWALFACERIPSGSERDLRAFALLTGVFVLWALGGHVESAVSGAALLLVGLLVRPDARRRIGRVLAAGLLAVGISAFALLPHALAILASERFALAAQTGGRGFWPAGLVTIFFPRVFGDLVDSPMIPGRAGPFPEMAVGYFGIVAWACVLLVLRPGSSRRREELALAIPAAIGLAVAIGLWPFGAIARHVPLLRLMSPLRFLSWLAICGSALAAFELDRLREDLGRLRSARLWPALTAAALAAVALAVDRIFRDRHAAAGGLASQRDALFLVLAALAAFALAGALRPGTSGRALVAAVAAVAAVELFVQGERLARFGRPAELAPDTPLLRFLRDQPRPFRVVGEGTALFPGSNVFARLEDVRTHDPAERRDYVEFLDRTAGYRPTDYFKKVVDLNAPSLDFLNVKYLIAAPGRASPGPKWRPAYSGSDGTLFENASVMPRVVGPARISEYAETADTVSFRASVQAGAPAPVIASLADDGGWTARDEAGRRIPTRRANGAFLGLLLPPGDHHVHLRYVAPGFRVGALLSGATLVSAAVLLAISRRKTA